MAIEILIITLSIVGTYSSSLREDSSLSKALCLGDLSLTSGSVTVFWSESGSSLMKVYFLLWCKGTTWYKIRHGYFKQCK